MSFYFGSNSFTVFKGNRGPDGDQGDFGPKGNKVNFKYELKYIYRL